MRKPSFCGFVLLAFTLLAACEVFTPGDGGPPSELWIEDTGVVLQPGETLRLTAMARESDETLRSPPERFLPRGAIRWWSEDDSVVRISDTGAAEAVGLGSTTVWIEAGSKRDSATVAVRDPDDPPHYRWKEVAVGEHHVCALTQAGEPYCWGDDYYGRLGRGGLDQWRRWTAHRLPQRVAGEQRFVELVAGARQTCGRTAGNEVYCWGDASTGGIGRGSPNPMAVSSPQRIDGNPEIVQLSSGYTHVSGLTSDGQVLTWGNNFTGQVGDGTHGVVNFRFSPTAAETEARFSSVGAGNDHTCALTEHGEVWCWGRNDGPIILSEEPMHPEVFPVPVLHGDLRFTQIAAGERNTCALVDNGQLYCWGGNHFRHAGAPGAEFLLEPTRVEDAPSFTRIKAASYHACGVDPDGNAFCWGGNGMGELGIEGTLDERCDVSTSSWCTATPTLVRGGHRWAHLDLMGNHPRAPTTCGVTTEGALYCWGSNWDGKLGIGRPDVESSQVPVRVADPL